MPATKRKASFASPYERPIKLSKRTTSTTVSRALSRTSKTGSIAKRPLAALKFPSLGAKKISTVKAAKVSASAPVSDMDIPTPPALRRASTLTIEEDKDSGSMTKKTVPSKPVSMSKKSSSFIEEGTLVTKLSGLKSGSIVGVTSVAMDLTKEPSSSKSLSRKSSSVRSTGSVPKVPTGLTKLAMTDAGSKGSLRITKSTLLADVDETEMESALASLRSTLSKRKSSLSKSLSAKSASSGATATLLKRKSTAKSIGNTEKEMTEAEDADMDTSVSPTDGVGAPALPPGGLTEVAISFDTTGSMYGCLEEVRAKIQDLVQRLQADIPGIRISVIAHGDYCDEHSSYLVKWIDFGSTLPEICEFVKNVERTGGGDGPECYELVLKRAREALSWTPGSQRILVVIGDDDPHEPGYRYGGKTYNIDWREECTALKEMGVKVYGIQAGYGSGKRFYEQISKVTNGKHIELKNFSSMFDFIMMICYRESNPDMMSIYEEEMRARSGRLAADVSAFLNSDDTPGVSGTSGFVFGTFPKPPKARKTSPSKRPTKPKTAGAKKPTKGKTPTKINAKGSKKPGKRRKTKKPLKQEKILKRERLPHTCMNKGCLRELTWSKWVKVLVPTLPANKEKTKFTKSRTQQGYIRTTWFGEGFKVPAVYEFAVQRQGRQPGKKYVVYCRFSRSGFKRTGTGCSNLLRHRTVRREADEVLKQGCCIFVRRGTTVGEPRLQHDKICAASNYIRDNFDYAWKKYIWRKNSSKSLSHRALIAGKGGASIVMSHSDF